MTVQKEFSNNDLVMPVFDLVQLSHIVICVSIFMIQFEINKWSLPNMRQNGLGHAGLQEHILDLAAGHESVLIDVAFDKQRVRLGPLLRTHHPRYGGGGLLLNRFDACCGYGLHGRNAGRQNRRLHGNRGWYDGRRWWRYVGLDAVKYWSLGRRHQLRWKCVGDCMFL